MLTIVALYMMRMVAWLVTGGASCLHADCSLDGTSIGARLRATQALTVSITTPTPFVKPDSSQSERLTSEQLNLLLQYRQKWLQFAWSMESINQATAIEAIDAMYRQSKLEPLRIEFCANPLELRERVEAYLEHDPESLRQPWYYSLYGCWLKIRNRLDVLLSSSLHGQMGHALFNYLEQHLQDPLEKHLHRQWDIIRHEVGLHWRRGLEAQLWEVMQYPTWLISHGALIDFCVTELGYTWQEEDWLIERGVTCKQEQWQLMQTLAAQVGWVVPLIGICWVCDRPTKLVFDRCVGK